MTQPIPFAEDDDAKFWARLQTILATSLERYQVERPVELAARVEYCRRNNRHGMSLVDVPDAPHAIGVLWGDKPFLAISRAVFDDDAYFEDLSYVEFAAPDDLSGLDGG
jgi:hypothetical protein